MHSVSTRSGHSLFDDSLLLDLFDCFDLHLLDSLLGGFQSGLLGFLLRHVLGFSLVDSLELLDLLSIRFLVSQDSELRG